MGLRRRLEKRIYIPLPDAEGRRKLLDLSLSSVVLADDVNLDEIQAACEGYSGADVSNVCRDASMMEMRQQIAGKTSEEIASMDQAWEKLPVTRQHFQNALANVCSSVNADQVARHENWMKEFGAS